MRTHLRNKSGFTLFELVVVIIIVGVLSTIGMRSLNRTVENRKYLATKQEMEVLKKAIVGDPEIKEGGMRVDYGYVGDTGQMPSALEDLVTNPSVTGWDGPYINVDLSENPDDYKNDAWGDAYTYDPGTSTGTPTLTSDGAGDSFTLNLAQNYGSIMNNTLRVRVYNVDGVPLNDLTAIVQVAYNGSWHNFAYGDKQQFRINTVPVGNRDIRAFSGGDTAYTSVSVTPQSDYSTKMTVYPVYGTIQYVGGSAGASGDDHEILSFTVENTGVASFEVTRMVPTWQNGQCLSGGTAYLEEVRVGGTTYWKWNTNGRSARVGSGSEIILDSPLTLAPGQTDIDHLVFKDQDIGTASGIDVSGADYTFRFIPAAGNSYQIAFSLPQNCAPAQLVFNSATLQSPQSGGLIAPSTQKVSVSFNNSGTLSFDSNALTTQWNQGSEWLSQIQLDGTAWDVNSSSGDKYPFPSTIPLDAGTHAVVLQFSKWAFFSAGSFMADKNLTLTFQDTGGSTQSLVFNSGS